MTKSSLPLDYLGANVKLYLVASIQGNYWSTGSEDAE